MENALIRYDRSEVLLLLFPRSVGISFTYGILTFSKVPAPGKLNYEGDCISYKISVMGQSRRGGRSCLA